jgi:hypothetical protein
MGSATGKPNVYALDRSKMLGGQPAPEPQHRTAPALPGIGFHSLPPADLDGTALPPAGSPAFFVRNRDDEVTNPPGTADPTRDYLELWEFDVDWTPSMAGTDFSLQASIPIADFDSELCGFNPALGCFPQPGTSTLLNPLRYATMWRLQYRNLGPHQSIVGNFVVDVDGTDHGGIRWFELRRVGTGAWSLFQEGTWAGEPPDAHNRWLGSIAMDRSGNMALGYNVVSTTLSPSILWVGRTNSDPPGVMSTGEAFIWAGQYYSSDGRWGDYSSMNVDPVDDCTFWFTTEHARMDHRWATRIARFRFDSPTCVNAVAPTCGGNCVRIDPVADAYVSKPSLMANHGGAATLIVGRSAAAKGSSEPSLERIFLGFNLNVALATNATVTQAILHAHNLTTFGYPPDPPPNAAVYRNDEVEIFDEFEINWSNKPDEISPPAHVLWSLATSSTPAWVTLDVTSLATDCWNNRQGQCSWQIQWGDESTGTTAGAYFVSREDTLGRGPYLDVTYTVP